MQKINKKAVSFFVIAVIVLGVIGFFSKGILTKQFIKKDFKNTILLGWDGVQSQDLNKLVDKKKMPNFVKHFKEGGSCVDSRITTGATETKPGWAEILTGYSGPSLGIENNNEYKPVSKGYSVFERLQDYFGKENIKTVFISGKLNNTGARGPHKICRNCRTRNAEGDKFMWWDESKPEDHVTFDGQEPILEDKEGEPWYLTSQNIDYYQDKLKANTNVLKVAFTKLETYKNDRFFMFMHFEEPDEQGHLYGEGSEGYLNGLESDDKRLGELVEELKRLGLFENTKLYLATDHGFDLGKKSHRDAPNIFFCSQKNELVKKGDRKDVTPTILESYGIDIYSLKPDIYGESLLKK